MYKFLLVMIFFSLSSVYSFASFDEESESDTKRRPLVILIVDDSAIDRKLASLHAQSTCVKLDIPSPIIRIANSAPEGLKMFEELNPHIIITDFNMSGAKGENGEEGFNGDTLVEQIRKTQKGRKNDLYIIMRSAEEGIKTDTFVRKHSIDSINGSPPKLLLEPLAGFEARDEDPLLDQSLSRSPGETEIENAELLDFKIDAVVDKDVKIFTEVLTSIIRIWQSKE